MCRLAGVRGPDCGIPFLLLVTLENTKPGMKLAVPIASPAAPDRTLLKTGYALEARTIRQLQRLEVRSVWVSYPGLEVLDKHIDPRLRQEQQVLATKLLGAFESVQGQSSAKVSYGRYVTAMARLIESMLSNSTARMFLGTAVNEYPSLVDRSSAVAHLSLLIGMKLKEYIATQRGVLPRQAARNLTNLGLGAMLHDIGTMQLDPAVRAAFEGTGDISDPAWQEHTRLGYEAVSGTVAPSAAVIVRHHHQLWDGSGFPRHARNEDGLPEQKGDAIHIFARIVSVAETFVRLCHPSRRVLVPAVQAIAQMIEGSRAAQFDPTVLCTFLAVTPPYPPGKIVQLSDDSWAVPVDHTPRDPCRPTVQLIDAPDALGEAGGGQVIDLRDRQDLSVVRADGHEVGELNFRASHLPRFSHSTFVQRGRRAS